VEYAVIPIAPPACSSILVNHAHKRQPELWPRCFKLCTCRPDAHPCVAPRRRNCQLAKSIRLQSGHRPSGESGRSPSLHDIVRAMQMKNGGFESYSRNAFALKNEQPRCLENEGRRDERLQGPAVIPDHGFVRNPVYTWNQLSSCELSLVSS